MLHLLSLFYWIYNGNLDYTFFGSVIDYPYSNETIRNTYIFNLIIFLAYLLGWVLSKKLYGSKLNQIKLKPYYRENKSFTAILKILLIVFISTNFLVFISANGNYWEINKIKESLNFIFELRVLINLLCIYLLLNKIPLSALTKIMLFIYFLSLCMLQARSVIFEFIFAIITPYLISKKINLKIFIILCITPIMPNIIVAFRFLNTYSPQEILMYFFSFEYLTLFNLIVSESILKYTEFNDFLFGETYLTSIKLILPSFIRDIFEISVDRGSDIANVRYSSGVHGGGFSMVGELFMNFGYFSFIPVFVYSLLINSSLYHISKKYLLQQKISFIECITPLILVMTILSLRNDTASLIKYIIQLIFIACSLSLLIKLSRKNQSYP
ncbi:MULTISPECIES: O-antigen polymerase [unclassified Providencia]|uniref:O-antigen polymerase n=1 Tax=unclassified Providencia TaxID=2633465 RepID=UPI002349E7F3|nr:MULTISPECIES: O-antigen polymerase [unclassified Providencia]